MANTNVFVYGTLKRCQRNHHVLAGQEFLGEACTLPRYRIYEGGHPCLVEDERTGGRVQGEVWSVTDEVLEKLDHFEGVPDLYSRRAIAIERFAPPVWAYFYNGDVSGLRDCGNNWPSGN